MKAIVNFRTLPNGSYKWMNGKRRGYWRVLIVRDETGCLRARSKNVTQILYEGRHGIENVTRRSAYYIGDTLEYAADIANRYNSGDPALG